MGVTHHDGMSVYGSGLWRGKKTNLSTFPGEFPFFGGAFPQGAVFADGGVAEVVGTNIVSSRLSTVIYAVATLGMAPVSGLSTTIAIGSGNAVSLQTYYITTSSLPVTSSISSPVNWLALGY